MHNPLSDQEIVRALKSGGSDFEEKSMQLFYQLQTHIPTVKDKLALPQIEIQKAYADALVILIGKLKTGQLAPDSNISNQFYSIFYSKADDRSKIAQAQKEKKKKDVPQKEPLKHNALEKELLQMADKYSDSSHVVEVIETIGNSGKNILVDWGYFGYTMNKIAERAKFNNAESAFSMKEKCLKKLKLLLADKMYQQ